MGSSLSGVVWSDDSRTFPRRTARSWYSLAVMMRDTSRFQADGLRKPLSDADRPRLSRASCTRHSMLKARSSRGTGGGLCSLKPPAISWSGQS